MPNSPDAASPSFPDDIAHRINQSEARVIKAVFPSITNHHNTLFGGEALAWMKLPLLRPPASAEKHSSQ